MFLYFHFMKCVCIAHGLSQQAIWLMLDYPMNIHIQIVHREYTETFK